MSGALFDRTGSYLVIYLCGAGIGLVGLFTLAAFVLMTREAASAGPRAR
jgi:hypothetical protein